MKAESGWENNGNATDDYGFSALPGGFRYYTVGIFGDNIGFWWTATERSSDDAYYRATGPGDDRVLDSRENKNNGYSVRCVED